MVTITTHVLSKLTKELDTLSQDKASGDLILSNQHHELGRIRLFSGRLLYINSIHHPVRRFLRATEKHCPDWALEPIKLEKNQPWEYQQIYHGIVTKQLSISQTKPVIAEVAKECLFELVSDPEYKSEWKPKENSNAGLSLYLTLSGLEVQGILKKAAQMQQEWLDYRLETFNPSLAPIVKQGIDNQSFAALKQYLNGKFTLWDIAVELKKSMVDITRYLLPLVGKNVVQFQDIPDLPLPNGKKSEAATAKKKGLIACIDDSPVVAHNLKKILMPAGYHILTITEPMHGFSQLIDHKPDLIFLDLNMPNANGYSVCQFLRNSPVFEKTPIIILTAHDTIIDRSRAKLVGATDFLGKPAPPDELLAVVKKHL